MSSPPASAMIMLHMFHDVIPISRHYALPLYNTRDMKRGLVENMMIVRKLWSLPIHRQSVVAMACLLV
jgi:hypothetical protein